MSVYVTTYCNFAHNLQTGRPIGHECAILPVKALRMEYLGNIPRAIEIIQAAKPLRTVVGRAPRAPKPYTLLDAVKASVRRR